jgi:hypothetical protein
VGGSSGSNRISSEREGNSKNKLIVKIEKIVLVKNGS